MSQQAEPVAFTSLLSLRVRPATQYAKAGTRIEGFSRRAMVGVPRTASSKCPAANRDSNIFAEHHRTIDWGGMKRKEEAVEMIYQYSN